MMGLYFLVLFAVGILRPIRNTLALDGLAEGDFYQVYLISAVVILFAPAFNHVADRVAWRKLIPATAAFFALNLIGFRAIYSEGSAALGMVFYGWYDLFAAALVTQFFMAVQVFFNARDAKSAVPLVIAAGSLGATLGGLTTGALAQTVGTPNLLLVAAAFVAVFSLALPFLWAGHPSVRSPGSPVKRRGASVTRRDFVRVFSNRQIRLIAGLVLVTVVVKTLVDYEFNEAVAAYAGDRDAISSFQGYVFGAINWLPILILLPLGPVIKRWGVGFAVLLLPVAMLGFTTALAVAFSVWTATLAKAGDATFRYSAERTGREILYIPVPTELKLKAKAYVDVAVEKGLGKALSGLLIFVLLAFIDYRRVAWVALALSAVWCLMALAAKRQYVLALADSIRGRFANLDGGFASLTERSTLAMVESALRGDTVEVGFGLDLVEQAGSVDAGHLADELELLLGHPEPEVRRRVLRLLGRFPDLVPADRIRERLEDDVEPVRVAAVHALIARSEGDEQRETILAEQMRSKSTRERCATLAWLASAIAVTPGMRVLASRHLHALLPEAESETGPLVEALARMDSDTRKEIALAAGLLESGPAASSILTTLLDDEDDEVAAAAVRSAGLVGSTDLQKALISTLAHPSLRGEARHALVAAADHPVDLCARSLLDPKEHPIVRRTLPSVLGGMGGPDPVRILSALVIDGEADRALRYQALKTLNKLRASNGDGLALDTASVVSAAIDEAQEGKRLAGLRASLVGAGSGRPQTPGVELLGRALTEAWEDRREAAFRLLGLVFSPDEVYRSHFAVTRTEERARANALEWLERTVGRDVFIRVLPVLATEPDRRPPHANSDSDRVLDELAGGPDPWLSTVAGWIRGGEERSADEVGQRLELIEKVFLLQRVDLLQGARSSHLGLLASIAEEVDVEPGEVLIRAGDLNDCLYVIVRGAVELSGVADHTLAAGPNTPFGTWSLIDTDPSVVGARALEATRLIRITRSDFQELLSDHPELAAGILQGLARRVRALVT